MQAKASDDLIHDQQRAIFSGNVAQTRKKARFRQDHAHIGGYWLNDNRGNFIVVLREQALHSIQIVVRRIQGNAASTPGTPGHSAMPKVARPEPDCERKLSE